MLQKILFSSFLILLTSCGDLPPSPEIYICAYNQKVHLFQCSSNKDENKYIELSEVQADKYIAVSPDDWGKVQGYVKDLKKSLLDCKKP